MSFRDLQGRLRRQRRRAVRLDYLLLVGLVALLLVLGLMIALGGPR